MQSRTIRDLVSRETFEFVDQTMQCEHSLRVQFQRKVRCVDKKVEHRI